ncbi:hypothetical protein B0H13DRAFT_2136977, partial [Mycena leptocephala]
MFPLPLLSGVGRAGSELRGYVCALVHSQRWRSAGVVRERIQGPARPSPSSLSSPSSCALVFLSVYAYARLESESRCGLGSVRMCILGAYHTLVLALALIIERTRRGVHGYPHRRRCFYTDTEGALRRSGYTFRFGWALEPVEMRMEMENSRGYVVGAHAFCSSLPSLAI